MNDQEIFNSLKEKVHSFQHEASLLSSGISPLDELLGGGLPWGHIIEWGLPWGQKSRILPLLFLRHSKRPILWVEGREEVRIYPTTWAFHGIPMERTFFVHSQEPVRELKPIFLERTFGIIVLDCIKGPGPGDLAFVTAQARAHNQLVLLLRPYRLNSRQGNPFAHLRLNGGFSSKKKGLEVTIVKGKRPGGLLLKAEDLV